MIKRLLQHPVTVLLLVCVAVFFMHLEVMYVNIMEARNFVTAREMVTDGNWLLTTMNGLPRYEKPPLPTWLTAVSGMLFGMKSLFALRLPAALAATFMVWMLYRFSALVGESKSFGLKTAVIAVTSFYIVFSGRNGQWDIFAHSFMIAGIYFFFRFLKYRNHLWKHALLAAFFTGCSFLSKGPVSLYALFLPFLLAYGWVYRFNGFKVRIFPFIAFLLLAVGLGLSWYVYVRLADPEAFLAIATEEAVNWKSYNIRPFYYYWSFFTQSGIWTISAFAGLLYPYLKNRVRHKKAYLFGFLWTVFSVVLLSLIPEKKSRYLLPVLIPLALTTAFYIDYLIRDFAGLKRKRETFPVYFNFGLIAGIGIAFPLAGYLFFGERLAGLEVYFILVSIILLLTGISIFIQLKKKNIRLVFWLTIAFTIGIITFGFPIARAFNTNTNFRNVDGVREYVEKNGLKLYVFSEIAPETVWHYGQPVPLLRKNNRIIFPSETGFGVVVVPDEEEEFRRTFEADFTLELIEVFNLNYQKEYKNRLIGKFYRLTKRP